MSSSRLLYLIDVSGLCYRAYYAISGLVTSYGQPTGAVFGFINILNKILKNGPEYLACCFDVSRETFRQKKFAEYKIQRPPMPDALVSQMPLIKEVISAYNISGFELPGYEADDLIASLAMKARAGSLEVMIISSDKDMLQLVDDKIKAFDPKKDKDGLIYDRQEVKRRYGVKPENIIDIIALMGDAADNIPGVPGVGEKTALTLIQEFGSIDNLIKNAADIKSSHLKKLVLGNLDNIRLSRDLARLDSGLDIPVDFEQLKARGPDYEKLFSLFKKLEFNSLLRGIPAKAGSRDKIDCHPLDSAAEKWDMLARIGSKKELFFALDKENNATLFFILEGTIYSLSVLDRDLAGILCDPGIKKISHNLKEAKLYLARNNLRLEGLYFDTMLAAYLLDSSAADKSLEGLAFRYIEEQHAQGSLPPERQLDIIYRLMPVLQEKLKDNSQEELLYNLELPLVDVLISMQNNGVCVDRLALHALSKNLEKRLIELRDDIYALNNGQEFNLNSPKQLAVALFERLKLPIVKKTKTGPSTDEEVLRKLSKKHKIAELILEFRSLSKMKNTYVDTLPNFIDSKTNRIHAGFDQIGTETGRLSSSGPNLQNIPIKGNIAGIIRKAFVAEAGSQIISADYSQIELRVLAHFSKDKVLLEAFNNDLDVHRNTASIIFGADEKDISDAMRETAKRINFGIVYGMSGYGLAKDLGIAPIEAQAFIEAYFLRYPKVKTFIEGQIKSAGELGYVATISGRRRYLPAIKSSNGPLRSFAERQAVNSPIQGSAADLIKLAMISIHGALKDRSLKALMIMQIHDELVFEVPASEISEALVLIRERMEKVFQLDVPIKVNIKKGPNWLDMEPA